MSGIHDGQGKADTTGVRERRTVVTCEGRIVSVCGVELQLLQFAATSIDRQRVLFGRVTNILDAAEARRFRGGRSAENFRAPSPPL